MYMEQKENYVKKCHYNSVWEAAVFWKEISEIFPLKYKYLQSSAHLNM